MHELVGSEGSVDSATPPEQPSGVSDVGNEALDPVRFRFSFGCWLAEDSGAASGTCLITVCGAVVLAGFRISVTISAIRPRREANSSFAALF
jgi:hypothetical protein